MGMFLTKVCWALRPLGLSGQAKAPEAGPLGWWAAGVSGHTDFPLLCPGDPTGEPSSRQVGGCYDIIIRSFSDIFHR